MATTLTKTISYWIVSRSGHPTEATYECEYVPFANLPRAGSIDAAVRTAIAETSDVTKREVLNDLYRYLVFANYAKPGGPGKKGARRLVLAELDVDFAYRGRVSSGEAFASGPHPGGPVLTNAVGATLCLVMASRDSIAVKRTLGGILVAMLAHPVFTRSENGWPRVDLATLRDWGLR